jgi:hexosaminidase
VVPEFDIPGHSTSWLIGYPELGSAAGPYRLARNWGIQNPCLDPTNEKVYPFLEGFLGEMAALFPDRYFHIGGDEVNGNDWKANARIQQFKRAHGMKTEHDLQAYFNQRVLAILKQHGKIVVGWDEILHPDLPHEIVIHSWRGQKSLAEAARQGFSGILSNGYYLDLMHHADQHYAVDPLEKETAGLSAEERKRVLGGEACEWAEFVTPENIDARIWPRNAVIAERLS